jgi:hypothetical protein
VRAKLDEQALPGVNNTLLREFVYVVSEGALPPGASEKVRYIFEGILK